MKQFAIIGLSSFGRWMLEELATLDVEILIIDKDHDVVQQYKDKATYAYVADVINEETIRRLVPETLDCAIIDLGDKLEVSILVVNYLKKIGIRHIVAQAETTAHEEILSIVGATQVVFPSREAAKRVTPMLFSSTVFNYMPISGGLVIAEVRVQERFWDKSAIEAKFRQDFGINIIAVRKNEEESGYLFFAPDYKFKNDDILLIVGTAQDVDAFMQTDETFKKERSESAWFRQAFKIKKNGKKK